MSSAIIIILSLLIIPLQGEIKVARLPMVTLEECARHGIEFTSQAPGDFDARSLAFSCTVIDKTEKS
jgi:hypothetical protein